MLELLHIENVAVIEKADIEFNSGLSVLTGETGAGKSIIIDSLGAVLGGRVSRELVRNGTSGAVVTAVFGAEPAEEWCRENGIEPEDGQLILSRRISAEGRNTCRINGVPVSVAELKSLGQLLLDIHGQNDGQKLLNEGYHLRCLDNFGGLDAERDSYCALYEEFRAVQREMDSLTTDEAENARRADTLKYQINEIERAELRVGERDETEARLSLLRNAGKLADAVNDAYTALYGGDGGNDGDGAIGLIYEAEGAIGVASRWSEQLSELRADAEALRYSAEDIAARLRDFAETLDFEPEELDRLETRLDLLRRLSRKYGADEKEMLAYMQSCRDELERIDFSAERLEELEKELDKKKKAALAAAEILSEHRKAAAAELSARIRRELNDLSMPGVEFVAEILPQEADKTGVDFVRFLMSANAGEPAGRISRIASGGELARIILAMKNVLSEKEGTPTMVFDEIDTGVSGIAAQRVGEKLSELAKGKQVLCVTHLPQIAAMADNQFCIEKRERDGRTFTEVKALDREGRRREIARLTGGDNITSTTLTSAEEQIEAAEKFRAGRDGK